MPSLRFRTAATTTDALANRRYNVIPPGGAIINMFATCVTATDTMSFSIGDRVVIDTSVVNIESSTTVVDTDRDQLLFNEVSGPGQMFLPITVTTAMNILILLRFL